MGAYYLHDMFNMWESLNKQHGSTSMKWGAEQHGAC